MAVGNTGTMRKRDRLVPRYDWPHHDKISLTFTAGSVCLCGVCGHVVIFGLSVRVSWYRVLCGGCVECDVCAVLSIINPNSTA